ncbi:MAG: hypothetical protein EBR67_00940 [Proteobacteria bacterium]|nr:hypothetical protein [Pseudomonadota bacterium]
MNWFNNFSGGFNNNSNFGYHGNTTCNTTCNTNPASNMTTPSSNTIGLGNGSTTIGLGPGTGWGNRSYANQSQPYDNFLINGFNPWKMIWATLEEPYDNFLINGFNPGYEQYAIVGTRNRRRDAEQAIDSIGQQGGFFGNFAYPRSLYGLC